MNISTAAPAAKTDYAHGLQAREMARQAKADEKRAVAQNVVKAMSAARFDAPEQAKQAAKAKVIEIVKRLQLLKKLFGGNPREMARALKQIFKELRAAVKAYKDAGGEEMSLAGQTAAGGVANSAPAKTGDAAASAADDAQAETGEGEAPAETAEGEAASAATDADSAETGAEAKTPGDDAQTPPTAAQGSAFYDAAVGKMRKSIGEDGLDFVKVVRQLVNSISDILERSRGQAKAKKPDKDTDKAFEDADKEMRELRRDLDDMAREIHNAAPDAGMKLSMDA